MPKKTHIYRDFSGGENTSANPKIIGQHQEIFEEDKK